jgi:hypothetical protein
MGIKSLIAKKYLYFTDCRSIWCKELKKLRNLEPYIFNSLPDSGQIRNKLLCDRYVPEDRLGKTRKEHSTYSDNTHVNASLEPTVPNEG